MREDVSAEIAVSGVPVPEGQVPGDQVSGVRISRVRNREAKESAIAQGFQAILGHIRDHGLSDNVAVVETWLPHVSDAASRGQMARLLGSFWLRREELDKALRFSDMANDLLDGDPAAAGNAMLALARSGRWEEAIARARHALTRFGEHFHWHRILCAAHGQSGQTAEARHHGTRCLAAQDAAAAGASTQDLATVPVPRFDPSRPERNVISFSLFGDSERLLRAAVLNARAARFLYLGWTCRFYIDDAVPPPVVQTLRAEGCRLLKVEGLPARTYGSFWRFLVADDPLVDRYIVRDAGALLNIRECVAVQEWLASDRHFHVMRDHLTHCEPVVPGLWGGVRGALPPVGPSAQRYIASRDPGVGWPAGHDFLRDRLWPVIRSSALTHDSQFAFGQRRDFPETGRLPPGCHAGCDARAMRPRVSAVTGAN